MMMSTLLVILFLTSSLVFCSQVKVLKQQSVPDAFDQDTFYELEGENIRSDADDFMVPPPPGSELMKTRKRSMSFHKSFDEMENLDAKEVFMSSGSFDFDHETRNDSDSTIEEEWEGFIMDHSALYPSRTSSTETIKINEKQRTFSNSPTGQLRQVFYNFHSTRPKSFTSKACKPRSRLTSFSEAEEEASFDLEEN